MNYDLEAPAQLLFAGDALDAPADWTGAEDIPTLRQALEAAVGRIDEAPWIRSGGTTFKPADVDALWKEAFRPLSD